MKKYLAGVATIALIAGVGMANAQSPGSMEKKESPGASSTMPSGSGAQPSPSQSSPSQKQLPSAQSESPSKGTVGQAPSAAPKADMKSDTKSDMKAGAATDSKSGTNAQSDMKSGTSAQTGTKSDTKSGSSAQTDTKSGSSAQTDTKSSTTTTGAAASGSINLTAQQKTEIRTKVLASAPRVEKVNFSLNVGTVVPRTVHIVAVPETLVVIHPQWRGYRYFVVGDEIVIVEPDSLKIVAVLAV